MRFAPGVAARFAGALLAFGPLACGVDGPLNTGASAYVASPVPRSTSAAVLAPAVQMLRVNQSCEGPTCHAWSALLLSGGRDAENNAVAHEHNVSFAARTLDALGVGPEHVALLFGDGDDRTPDVSFEEPDARRFRTLYALGLWETATRDAREAVVRVRDHAFPPPMRAGRADAAGVLQTLAADASQAREASTGRDLLLYVTDHGLKGRDATNNVIVLWGRKNLAVRQLGAALDAQPPQRRVVSVMAQCFSGAFASLIYEGGDAKRPLAEHDRCGFFAAPADRPAAGCSPKADESLYDDYTTRFFSALSGIDRANNPAAGADLDGDGHVSFDEAHLAAIRLEGTLDVPVSSSEELLRTRHAAWVAEADADPRSVSALLETARPGLRVTAAALLAVLGMRETVSPRQLRAHAASLSQRCWPGLCEAEAGLVMAREVAHAAMRRAAGGTPPKGASALDLLGMLGDARATALADAARPHVDRVITLEAALERLQLASEAYEARVERLRRLVTLGVLEARSGREDDGEARRAYDRVRACETSGPWPSRR